MLEIIRPVHEKPQKPAKAKPEIIKPTLLEQPKMEILKETKKSLSPKIESIEPPKAKLHTPEVKRKADIYT